MAAKKAAIHIHTATLRPRTAISYNSSSDLDNNNNNNNKLSQQQQASSHNFANSPVIFWRPLQPNRFFFSTIGTKERPPTELAQPILTFFPPRKSSRRKGRTTKTTTTTYYYLRPS
mmetsp:Transcript_1138/g.3136  ORF Transcript_1138/g.3136 Transcript_1138/m.3136 type:complete len:116 (+) Transcript_1138:14-361(+)